MRILILSNLFPPKVLGGYEIACRNVAVGLRERGHEVEVLSSHAPVSHAEDPVWLHRGLLVSAFGPVQPHTAELTDEHNYRAGCSQFANTATLLAHLRLFGPDVVYVWNLYGIGGLALLDLLEVVGVPWVIHLMDNVPAYVLHGLKPTVVGLFGRRDLAIFTRAQAITMSDHLLKEVRETTGIRFETRPTIIPGWVPSTGVVQREAYLENGLLRLVTFGSLGAHKGTDIILDACERLVAGGQTAFRVDVYGFGAAASWVERAAQQGVSGYVRFLGPRSQSEVVALLPGYDAFLFPTWEREPFGFAPIEAAACGVVPIITRSAGVAERLVDRVHALKIDRNAKTLAAAIIKLMTGEVDVEKIGRRAARMVRSDLSFVRCLDSIERVLATADCQWDKSALDRSRLRALLYAKDALGQHLTAHT